MDRRPTNLLFLGAGNACRSQMAEGFARAKDWPNVKVHSAGATPAGAVNPRAIQVMAEAGVDISSYKAKAVDALPTGIFDLVITFCEDAQVRCPVLPGNPEFVHWAITDPTGAGGDRADATDAFRAVRDEIRRYVDALFDKGYLKALIHAKQQADLILDHISEGVIAHDLQRRILYFNAAAERITGYSRADVLNRDCHDVLSGGLCGGKCLFCDGSTPPSEAVSRDLEICTRSGERRHVATTIQNLENQHGLRVGVILCFRDLTREVSLARRLGEIEQFAGIIGRDPQMLALFDLIPELAESNAPVLIQGESGTGKELIASALHNEGPRASKLFVPVNCGALPEGLLESELFGHVRGAFTGAIRDKKGRFELADGGTIFLDEIGDISPAMQIKLLRVLQEGCFERVGSEKTIRVDVRVVSATNKDLNKEMAEGRFREDLYYRLGVVPLTVPPLRERPTDIPMIANHILQRASREIGREKISFGEDAMDFMLSYSWPGNVRELQNWIQFALIKCKGQVIKLEHLPPVALRRGSVTGTRDITPAAARPRVRLTAQSVRSALAQAGGNKVEAAKLLGVSRATLYRFMSADPSGTGHDSASRE